MTTFTTHSFISDNPASLAVQLENYLQAFSGSTLEVTLLNTAMTFDPLHGRYIMVVTIGYKGI